MTNPHLTTDLDLDAITATGWAGRGDFTAAEFERAERFYAAMRVHDERLARVRADASSLIEGWTGHRPRDVGSFGTGLNLETSDLDLGIGYPVAEREVLLKALEGHARFLGERATRFSTTRLVFSFRVEGVEVDLSALTVEDFVVAGRMLDQIAASMTFEERVCHTWVKHLLRISGRLEEYAAWKLVTYRRFCPEFNWVPIPEKTGT
ncbi:hypothetical protein RM780_10000 [Streptomyces sp. DSM 44917]|uniref:Nucleotidyltransferase n=1 Tax=Streptomyces boetiae TaxID=3075541 RepID=A0ABU2L6V1_9ACTN|nr:hypothetical protein [Streptomyces sp. DSM 44917]MDT0307295.1 hypothetical protein [Streptomyces sp. DSM 44917]